MMTDVRQIDFPHRRSDQGAAQPAHRPIVIVGAGPVGLVAALDLARKGHRTVVIDKKASLSDGSRAICWSKRTLEIMDRLDLGQTLLDKGVTWQKGKVFFDTRAIYEFDLLPETGHRMPAFINLQQYYFEHYCIEAAARTGLVDLRWQEEVTGLEITNDGALLSIATPDGSYSINAGWVIAADGARSTLRRRMGLGFEGRVFADQFLICDIRMKLERPVERWFWFDPPFNRGRSALLHRQADDVWRLDFQVGDQADRDEEVKPENVARRVRAMLGEEIDFAFEWISLYRFQSRRLQRFRHGRVLFAGEHTCELGTSTVDSAWLSGLREASRLLGAPVSLP
jgi:3-(3-hydroxy-phenyl)propionate hydroxylase